MTDAVVEVYLAFASTVSAKKTDTKCMPLPRMPRTMVRVEAAVTEAPDTSVEIGRRARACWMRIRRYLRELYNPIMMPSR